MHRCAWYLGTKPSQAFHWLEPSELVLFRYSSDLSRMTR